MKLRFSDWVVLSLAALLVPVLLLVIVAQDKTIQQQRALIQRMNQECPTRSK